ncbi:MAG: hypothetical protein QNJ17_05440 [Desulfocapsaceae bacterium]|nr:hypothetical protein [Desulfocapsaceae bacterium]
MNRGRKILIVCHCILNINAKIQPLAPVQGVLTETIRPYLDDGCGLFQLPCPEVSYLGMNRWGMTREQYDHPAFRYFLGTWKRNSSLPKPLVCKKNTRL